MNKIRIAIEGGAGYTAGELVRLLIHHPYAEVKYIHSESNADQPVSLVHTDLLGDTDLVFSEIDYNDCDLLFLCKGHGKSISFFQNQPLPPQVKIIDLSQDFRTEKDGFTYGLPELQRDRIASSQKIANPGCFATTIELALLPLASKGLMTGDVHITAITGSTGAGQAPSDTTHFSWRNNNISVYKPFRHQHLQEIGLSIKKLQPGFDKELNLIPIRGNFSRGILASMYTKCTNDITNVKKLYREYYQEHPFVTISDTMPDLKQVVNTNKCILYLEMFEDKLYIISIIDNLIKGASGQAIQNMNLMFGFPQDAGLRLKSIAF